MSTQIWGYCSSVSKFETQASVAYVIPAAWFVLLSLSQEQKCGFSFKMTYHHEGAMGKLKKKILEN